MGFLSNYSIKFEVPDVGIVIIDDTDQAICDLVHEKNNELKNMCPEILRRLPQFNIEKFKIQNNSYGIATWHDEYPDHDLYVTQCKRYIFFQYGPLYTAGFILHRDGSIVHATDSDLREYK